MLSNALCIQTPEEFEDRTIPFPNYISGEDYRQCTYEISSAMSYLTGVKKSVFENPHTTADLTVYEALSQRKEARIVRALSALRTAINLNFKRIDTKIMMDLKNLSTIEETKEWTEALRQDGVEICKANARAEYYVSAINQQMSQWIDRCKDLFPEWVEWRYIRSLFLFPHFQTNAKRYFERYMSSLDRLPYQVYINWEFRSEESCGNLFQNDQKFLSLLYERFGDTFTRWNSVHTESASTQLALSRFALEAEQIALVVDCENSDPIRLSAALQAMGTDVGTKLKKIILYNDVNASSCWAMLQQYCATPIEHCMTQRILQNKSMVDPTLIAGVCRMHYVEQVDSFLLASSDSDFISLVRSLDANFLWLVENEKVSNATLEELIGNGVPYCRINDFCDGGVAYKLQKDALMDQCRAFLSQRFTAFNVNAMLDFALQNTRIQLETKDKLAFKKRYLDDLRLRIDEGGNVTLCFG